MCDVARPLKALHVNQACDDGTAYDGFMYWGVEVLKHWTTPKIPNEDVLNLDALQWLDILADPVRHPQYKHLAP